jgi:hypothetical protein
MRLADSMVRCLGIAGTSLLIALSSSPSLAGDSWKTVASGIEHLHRTTANQDYHVLLVDLSRPEIWLRATGPGQNAQRTSSFASAVGATVAINGDLWDANNWSAYEPLGLAVGDGWQWRNDTKDWSFLACDVSKNCWYDPWGSLVDPVPRVHNAIGGMQDLLVIEGVGQSYDTSFHKQRHPRTATGVSQDGATLILLVVDGRRPEAIGMTFSELTAVMLEFGAWNAMNSDGGGSSTLVVSGQVKNIPSDGGERVVANHLAVMVAPQTDANCVGRENAKFCVDGTQMRTCTGGVDRGLGDCAYFGLTCEDDGLFAYCVDPRCTAGGNAAFCLDATRIAICEDGLYREGDCAGFGLPCVEGLGTAWCHADFRKAEPVASSLGAPEGGSLSATAGDDVSVWFDLRNVGLVTWQPQVTMLAPIPRDEPSALAGADWIAPHRAATVTSPVAPGEVGRFSFTMTTAGAGDHVLKLGLLDEGITWFADPPSGGGPEDGTLEVRLSVTDPTGGDAGVTMDGQAPVEGGATADSGAESGPGSGPGVHSTEEAEGCACRGAAGRGRPFAAPLGLFVGLWLLRRRANRP